MAPSSHAAHARRHYARAKVHTLGSTSKSARAELGRHDEDSVGDPASIPDVKVVRFARFCDERGYFSEHFRTTDIAAHPDLALCDPADCAVQRSFLSTRNAAWSAFSVAAENGQLVRPLCGRLIDFALDLRLSSPWFGKIIG